MVKSGISGGKSIRSAFAKVQSGLAVPMNEASRKALRPMLAAAKQAAPKEDGDLRRSLVIKRAESPKSHPVHVVGPSKDFVGKDGSRPVRYAHVTNYGRAANADGKGGIEGTRWLDRAFDGSKAEVISIFAREIGPAIMRRFEKGRL